MQFPTPDGLVKAVDGASFSLEQGTTLGVVGESGSGKSVTFMSVMGLINRKTARITGEVLFRGRDLLTMPPPRAPAPARREHRHGLPGPDDLASPDVPGGRPDRRGRPRPPQGRQVGRGHDGRRVAAAGGDPVARAAGTPVPVRVLGRHAPAGDDRHGAGPRPRPADRRRAHDGARRDRPGPDPRADRGDEGAPEHRRRPDQPQHGRGRRRRPERDDHVRRAAGGGRHPRRDLPRAAPPLLLGPARVDPAARRPRRAPAADRGLAALPDPPCRPAARSTRAARTASRRA